MDDGPRSFSKLKAHDANKPERLAASGGKGANASADEEVVHADLAMRPCIFLRQVSWRNGPTERMRASYRYCKYFQLYATCTVSTI